MKQLSLFNLNDLPDLSRGGSILRPFGDGHRWVVVMPDYWPAAANQMGENAFWRVQAEKRKAAKYVATYGHPLPVFGGKVKLTIIRLWAKKCRAKDHGNLVASTKFLEDALKRPRGREKSRRLGVIVDDSPKWLTQAWEQGASIDGKAYCVIVVEGSLVDAKQMTLGGVA